ncbi:MAG: hydrogenase nickel incorporation protein HypB [Cyanobacteria bacterium J06635_11]
MPVDCKTTLIQQLIKHTQLRAAVVVGDLATDCDAQKIRQTGAPAIQITTGDLCHLDAAGVATAVRKLDLTALDFMIIENVGNLVCPAMYHLGEDLRIVLMSVTEGEDKPLKYPALFKSADAVVISKTDLATAVEFDRKKAMAYLAQVVPQTPVFEISARSTKGLDAFHTYLAQALKAKRPSFSLSV